LLSERFHHRQDCATRTRVALIQVNLKKIIRRGRPRDEQRLGLCLFNVPNSFDLIRPSGRNREIKKDNEISNS
jgi:hypothetical protein